MADYKLVVYDVDDNLSKVAEITDFISIVEYQVENGISTLTFEIRGDHPAKTYLVDKAMVILWRRMPEYGVDWYREFITILRDEEHSYVNQKYRSKYKCFGLNHITSWRIIAFPAGSADANVFTADRPEIIAFEIAWKNAALFDIYGRLRSPFINLWGHPKVTSGVQTFLADLARSFNWYCFGANVLDESVRVLEPIGGFIDNFLGSQTGRFTIDLVGNRFDWFADKGISYGDVVFSLGNGNMADPIYKITRSQEKTVAMVAGQGDEDDRDIVFVTGEGYSATNDIEMFVDARDIDAGDTDGLEARGAAKLEETRVREEFSFTVLQTPSSAYGLHYRLHQPVRAIWEDVDIILAVTSVSIQLKEGDPKEYIDIGVTVVGDTQTGV